MCTGDLPFANKLPCAQRPTNCTKCSKDTGKMYSYICGGVARVVVPRVQIWREKCLPYTENKLSCQEFMDRNF